MKGSDHFGQVGMGPQQKGLFLLEYLNISPVGFSGREERGSRCHSLDELQKQLGSGLPRWSLALVFRENIEGMFICQELVSGSLRE